MVDLWYLELIIGASMSAIVAPDALLHMRTRFFVQTLRKTPRSHPPREHPSQQRVAGSESFRTSNSPGGGFQLGGRFERAAVSYSCRGGDSGRILIALMCCRAGNAPPPPLPTPRSIRRFKVGPCN